MSEGDYFVRFPESRRLTPLHLKAVLAAQDKTMQLYLLYAFISVF